MRTALVNGSACSSHARSRSSSALTTPPSAATRTSSTANCFRVERDVAAVAVDLAAERIQTQTCDLPHGRPVVGTPAVECSEPEHELSELERLREVVVGAELEPGGLVVETVGRGEHEDRHAAAGGDDAFGDLVAGGSRGCRGRGPRCRRRSRAATPARCRRHRRCRPRSLPGVGHRGWLLPDRARPQRSTHACSDGNELAHIAGISKTAYVPATPRCLDWRHVLRRTSANNDPSDSQRSLSPACWSSSPRSPGPSATRSWRPRLRRPRHPSTSWR